MPIAFIVTRRRDVNPFQQQLQLCPIQRHFIAKPRRVVELPLLQALGPHTIAMAVKVQHLQVGALAVDEHKQVTAGGIFLQLVLDQRGQTIKRLAHVGGPGVQPDPDLGFGKEHRLYFNRKTMPWPSSSSRRQSDCPGVGSTGNSSSGADTAASSVRTAPADRRFRQ